MNKLVTIRGWLLALLSACFATTRGHTWSDLSCGLTEADSDARWTTINRGLDQVVATHAPVNSLIVDSDRPDVLHLGTSPTPCLRHPTAGPRARLSTTASRFSMYEWWRSFGALPPIVYAGTRGGVFKMVEQRKLGTSIRNRRARSKGPLGVQFTRRSAR